MNITDHQRGIGCMLSLLLCAEPFRLCEILSRRKGRPRTQTGTERRLVLPTQRWTLHVLRARRMRLLLQGHLSQTMHRLLCLRKRMPTNRNPPRRGSRRKTRRLERSSGTQQVVGGIGPTSRWWVPQLYYCTMSILSLKLELFRNASSPATPVIPLYGKNRIPLTLYLSHLIANYLSISIKQ